MHRVSFAKVVILIFILIKPITLQAHDSIILSHAWISEAPPTVSILAGYLEIKNNTNETKILNAVSGSDFNHIEIHQSIIRNGMASMEKQNELSITPGQTLKLTPGGYHLMLFDPSRPLRSGDTVPLEFSFADGHKQTINATVEKRNNSTHEHHHH